MVLHSLARFALGFAGDSVHPPAALGQTLAQALVASAGILWNKWQSAAFWTQQRNLGVWSVLEYIL